MKKILALVLALVLMLGCTTTAFAASEPQQGMAEMEVTAYSYGSFFFSIPETIDFTNMVNNRCIITIGEYDLDTLDYICISIGNLNNNGCITMNHNTKEGITADLMIFKDYEMQNQYIEPSQPLIKVSYADLESNVSDQYDFYAKLSENAKAGGYTGTIQFYTSITQE